MANYKVTDIGVFEGGFATPKPCLAPLKFNDVVKENRQ